MATNFMNYSGSLPSRQELWNDLFQLDMNPSLENGRLKKIFQNVASYLVSHSDSELKTLFVEKINPMKAIETILMGEEEQVGMLENCYQLVDLDQLKEKFTSIDLIELARKDRIGLPKRVPIIDKFFTPLAQSWIQHSPTVRKILNWFIMFPINMITNQTRRALSYFNEPPEELWQIRGIFKLYISILSGWILGCQYFISYFASKRNAAAVAAGGAMIYGALYYITAHVLKLSTAESVGDETDFQNLSQKVRDGKIGKGVERIEEKSQLISCWTTSPFRIAFLTGDPGVGKTQFVENLAWSCVNDTNFAYYGKTVYSINTAQLNTWGGSHILDTVFEEIQGNEDNVILFFDEAHNAATSNGMQGNYIERFKTEFLDRNIRCVMATTTDEYNRYIVPNKPFVSRVKEIRFKPLSDGQIKNLLREEIISNHKHGIKIADSAYDAILHADENRGNPRKSLQFLQDVISSVAQWKPSLLNSKLQTEKDEKKDRVNAFAEKNGENPQWVLGQEGQKAFEDLQKLKESIKTIKTQIKDQAQQLGQIRNYQDLTSKYDKEIRGYVDELLDQKISPERLEETQKRYLYTKFVLLPHIRSSIQKAVKIVEEKFGEKIPLTIDAAYIKEIGKSGI